MSSQSDESEKEAEVCPICLNTLEENGMGIVDCSHCKLECGHTFHMECIETWILQQTMREDQATCPVCRKDIEVMNWLQSSQYRLRRAPILEFVDTLTETEHTTTELCIRIRHAVLQGYGIKKEDMNDVPPPNLMRAMCSDALHFKILPGTRPLASMIDIAITMCIMSHPRLQCVLDDSKIEKFTNLIRASLDNLFS